MATKRLPDDDATIITLPAKGEESSSYDEDALKRLYEEIIGGADNQLEFTVKKVRVGIKGHSFCFAYQPSDYTFNEMIVKTQTEFGDGEYRLYARDAAGKMRLNQVFYIEKNLKASALPTTSNDIVIQRLIEQNQTFFDRMEKLLEPKKSTVDWMQVATVAPAILLAIKEFLPKKQDINPLELMRLVNEIRESANDSSSDSMQGAIMKALEVFGKPIVEAGQKQQAEQLVAMQRENTALKERLKTATTPGAEKKPDPGTNPLAKITMLINLAVAGAKQDSDPVLYAELFVDQLDSAETQELLSFLSDKETALQALMHINSEVKHHNDFFGQLIDAFIEITTSGTNES